ncbi:MAG: hypothetical protein NVS2B16_16300 [Chloroflexota bacterium]
MHECVEQFWNMIGDGRVTPSMMERLFRGRFQPSTQNFLAMRDESDGNPRQIALSRVIFNPPFDICRR